MAKMMIQVVFLIVIILKKILSVCDPLGRPGCFTNWFLVAGLFIHYHVQEIVLQDFCY